MIGDNYIPGPQWDPRQAKAHDDVEYDAPVPKFDFADALRTEIARRDAEIERLNKLVLLVVADRDVSDQHLQEMYDRFTGAVRATEAARGTGGRGKEAVPAGRLRMGARAGLRRFGRPSVGR